MSVRAFAYQHTRVSLLREQLLSRDELQQLAEAELGGHVYNSLLNRIGLSNELPSDEHGIPAMEQACLKLLLDDIGVLIRPASEAHRRLLAYWTRGFELRNLKTLIRGKLQGLPATVIQAQLFDLGDSESLPLEELLATEDVAELLRMLEKGQLAEIAQQSRVVYEQEHDLFSLDATVDRLHLTYLGRQLRSLSADDRRLLAPLIGLRLDEFNLLWLLRYRFAYGLTPAETYYLLAPGGLRLDARILQEIVKTENINDALALLPPSYRAAIGDHQTTLGVGQAFDLMVWHRAETLVATGSFTIARSFAYICLRKLQLRLIQGVIKAKLLGLDPPLMVAALGGVSNWLEEAS